jgi:hypothetical protein
MTPARSLCWDEVEFADLLIENECEHANQIGLIDVLHVFQIATQERLLVVARKKKKKEKKNPSME